MSRAPLALAAALALGATGCEDGWPSSLLSMTVTEATLLDVDMFHFSTAAGFGTGLAYLSVRDTDGVEHLYDARLGLTGAGLSIKMSGEIVGDLEIDLENLGGVASGGALRGPYEGRRYGLGLGIGFSVYTVENEQGALIDLDALLVYGMDLGFEDVELDIDVDPL